MKKLTIVMITLFVGFLSCDWYEMRTAYIDNQTNDTIRIVFMDKSQYSKIQDAFVFLPKQKTMLYEIMVRASKEGCYMGIKKG
jgi:hypothetical protein